MFPKELNSVSIADSEHLVFPQNFERVGAQCNNVGRKHLFSGSGNRLYE
jgi:hypothetical protein